MHYRDSDGTRKKLPLTPRDRCCRRRHLLSSPRCGQPQHPERGRGAVVAARGPIAGDDDADAPMTSVGVIIMMDLLHELCVHDAMVSFAMADDNGMHHVDANERRQ